MKALDILNHIHRELNKNNTNDIWIDPNTIKEAIGELEKHYNEVQDLESEQEDLTFSERIDTLIDPEMNIEKVVRMIEDAKDLSYTKGESFNLIYRFIKNFNNEYMIIKKIK
jgi:hypothetical protein